MTDKKILIIIDDDPKMKQMAGSIAGIFANQPFSDYFAVTVPVDNFSATDLLPANAFFLGCEKPQSFECMYINDLFRHINLAGRPCGLFSSNAGAIKYLSELVLDSEADVNKPFIAEDEKVDSLKLKDWVLRTVKEAQPL